MGHGAEAFAFSQAIPALKQGFVSNSISTDFNNGSGKILVIFPSAREADVAVFNVREDDFGFTDVRRTKVKGKEKLEAELTIRAGNIVWDLNVISVPD